MDQPSNQPDHNTSPDAIPPKHTEDSQSGPPSVAVVESTTHSTGFYLMDYQKVLKKYSEDPSERRQGRIWIFLFLLISIIGAIFLGANGGLPRLGLRGIVCWEIIAIVDTFLFAIMYFSDLFQEAKSPEKLKTNQRTLLVGALWVVNLLFLSLALAALLLSEHSTIPNQTGAIITGFSWTYVGYLSCLTVSFLVFATLDFVFARDSKVFKKTREYWSYCLFVDGPAIIAFVVLSFYLYVLHRYGLANNIDIISGAVAMQMLIADTLYLVIASNFHLWLLANYLSEGCDC